MPNGKLMERVPIHFTGSNRFVYLYAIMLKRHQISYLKSVSIDSSTMKDHRNASQKCVNAQKVENIRLMLKMTSIHWNFVNTAVHMPFIWAA